MACSKADFGGQRGHDPRDIKSIYVANFVIATNAPQNLQTSYIRQVGRLAPPPEQLRRLSVLCVCWAVTCTDDAVTRVSP